MATRAIIGAEKSVVFDVREGKGIFVTLTYHGKSIEFETHKVEWHVEPHGDATAIFESPFGEMKLSGQYVNV